MARRKSKKTSLASQPDPRAPLDSQLLLQHLAPALKALEIDLLKRVDESPGLMEALQARCDVERNAERTADELEPWRRGVITQVAAAWVLSCVFVRILEDRGLLEQCRIAGPGAEGSQQEYMKFAPFLTERDYLLFVFRELCHFEVTRELFDEKHNLVWRITPSAEGARALLAVFRQGGAEAPAFRFGQADTRFLGDLYQDLSESVRKKYALLQTPDFVEQFILDRTLEPALETFGLDGTTLMDPTCGSGHFLLGAFERLYDRQLTQRPNLNPRDAAQRALEAVHGVDVNPYAVSIAKFRLLLAFFEKAELATLEGAPQLPLNVVVADSLYHKVAGEQPGQTDMGYVPEQRTRDWFSKAFALEEDEKAVPILRKRYAAVVGNPPYIMVDDKALNAAYRKRYRACYRSYSLAAPFAERFFELCRPEGFTGMITANSFMKREFGKALVQKVLKKVDLQLVVNTSGAYIPGHGTPTVLLFGQHRSPSDQHVRTVLANRGEPTTPEVPAHGLVWSSVAEHWHQAGYENEYISVVECDRDVLNKHPWSLGGGGAAELKELLESRAEKTLVDLVESIGRTTVVGEDDVWISDAGTAARFGLEEAVVNIVIGESVRDWSVSSGLEVLYPYETLGGEPVADGHALVRWLWPWRERLARRTVFGKEMRSSGRFWWEHLEHYTSKFRIPFSITFAFVATHNHFVLDRGGKVFNRSAPIIKLPEGATEDDHYALLAYLNSSTACFWMKQVFQPKHSAEHKTHPEPERDRYEHAGQGLSRLPVPPNLLVDDVMRKCGRQLTTLAGMRTVSLKALRTGQAATSAKLVETIGAAWSEADRIREQMIAVQEIIDWRVYSLFGLTPTLFEVSELRGLSCPRGDRPFERLVPRKSFVRARDHLVPLEQAEVPPVGDTSPILESMWKECVVLTRKSLELQLLEAPMFKRQWRDSDDNIDEFRYRAEEARRAVQDRLRRSLAEPGDMPVSAETLLRTADSAPKEWLGREAALQVIAEESVPYLAVLRHAAVGLEKHAAWQRTWDLQRREDAGEDVGRIPVPPKYDQKDFRSPIYWRLRGKLDVPKERFISYPGCESDEDKSPVYGWAGWNHLQRASALSGLYNQRRAEGWEGERVLPMLVGLLELLPWLKQWHNEPDEELGGERPAAQFEAFVQGELQRWKKTPDEARAAVLAWVEAGGAKPKKAAARKGGRKKAGKEAKPKGITKSKPSSERPAPVEADEGAAA